MAIDTLETKADLERFILGVLESPNGRQRRPSALFLPELAADPPAPAKGARVWCIKDNGAGKRAIRARFPTGAVQVLSTEP